MIPQAVHDAGGRIVLQILHSGPLRLPQEHRRALARQVAASTAARRANWARAEIEQTIGDFVRAAVARAQTAGYDGVEVMGSEGYLISQFLALRTNQRQDDWGGALENRMRFACEIVRRTRAATGPHFIIVYRISALELVEGGLSGEETVQLARAIEKAGATILNTGIGWHEARIPTIAQAVPRARLRLGGAAHQGGGEHSGDRLEPHQRAGDRRGHPRARRRGHGLARARDAGGRGVRQQGESRRPRRHQHLHRLQPGLPRPLLHRPAGQLRGQSEGRKRNAS